jgi:hypothetical protein
MLPALIAAGGSVVGGILGNRSARKTNAANIALAREQRQWALEDQREQWVRHRAASEAAGFNPLATMGLGQGVAATPLPQLDSTNYMGSAIADSALLVADSIAAKKAEQTAQKAQDLAATNAKLNSQIRDLTLRPKVGGIYAQRQSSPTLRQALGAPDEKPDQLHPLDDQLGTVDVPDPKLDRANPGYFAGLNWEATPGFSPGQTWEDRYGDTPLNWPIAMGQMSADFGYNAKKGVNYARGSITGNPVMTIGGREFVMERYVPKSNRHSWKPHGMRFDPNRGDAYYRPNPGVFP